MTTIKKEKKVCLGNVVKVSPKTSKNESYYYLFDIPGFTEKHRHYEAEYAPFTDALCFDFDYYTVLQDIKERGEVKTITDIGCAFGFQSEHFVSNGYNYIGIDACYPNGESIESRDFLRACKSNNSDNFFDAYSAFMKKLKEDKRQNWRVIPFFNEGHSMCKYFIGHFPEDLKDEMIGDCFISNMSVGYEHPDRVKLDEIQKGYARFQKGYYRGEKDIENVLDEIFPHKEVLHIGYMNNMVYYSR